MTLAMMMTATALFQEVESPLGHSKFFDVEGDAPEGGGGVDEQRQGMVDSIAESFEMLEDETRQERLGPQQIGDMYMSMRQVAEKWETSRPIRDHNGVRPSVGRTPNDTQTTTHTKE